MFRHAGLTDIGVEARLQQHPHGHSRRTIRLDLVRSMRPQIVELGLATERELEEWDAAARAHLENPGTIVLYGLLFLVWGRKRG